MKNKIKKHITLFFVFYASFISAQNTNGIVTYKEKFGSFETNDYTLYFNNNKSLYKQNLSNQDGEEILNGYVLPKINQIYLTDLLKKEILFIEGIANNAILAKDEVDIQWEIINEEKKIGQFNCIKAKTKYKNNVYEAWFTTEIPVPFGPWKFNSLPGLILECYDSTKFYYLYSDSIQLNANIDDLNTEIEKLNLKNPINMTEYKRLRSIENEEIYNELISKAGRDTYLKITTDYSGFLREPIK